MDILISVNQVPLIRFSSYTEALAAVARFVATGHPVERIVLTPLHNGEQTHNARRQPQHTSATPAGGSGEGE
jgi:hypothetical protein